MSGDELRRGFNRTRNGRGFKRPNLGQPFHGSKQLRAACDEFTLAHAVGRRRQTDRAEMPPDVGKARALFEISQHRDGLERVRPS
jgi:hypothetical protein